MPAHCCARPPIGTGGSTGLADSGNRHPTCHGVDSQNLSPSLPGVDSQNRSLGLPGDDYKNQPPGRPRERFWESAPVGQGADSQTCGRARLGKRCPLEGQVADFENQDQPPCLSGIYFGNRPLASLGPISRLGANFGNQLLCLLGPHQARGLISRINVL